MLTTDPTSIPFSQPPPFRPVPPIQVGPPPQRPQVPGNQPGAIANMAGGPPKSQMPSFPTPPPAPGFNRAMLQPGGAMGGQLQNSLIQSLMYGDPYGMYGPPSQGALGAALAPIFAKMNGGQTGQAAQAPSAGSPPAAPSATPLSEQGSINASSPQAFVQNLAGDAQQVADASGIPANVLLAIAAHETGWGKALVGDNLMGIKGTGQAGSISSPTQEYQGGQFVNTTSNFRAYNSPLQSLQDFADFLNQNPRYAPALAYLKSTGDSAGFLQLINQEGYATDPIWYQGVNQIANQITGMLAQSQPG